jgi:hypothetical protein
VLKQLDELMSPTHNRRNYRRLEAEAVPPCVPYLGVSLGDLFFIESNEMGTCCARAQGTQTCTQARTIALGLREDSAAVVSLACAVC